MTSQKRKATDLSQNPYIDLVDTDSEEDVEIVADARIYPAPPGYSRFLKAEDEVRASNGYIFREKDKFKRSNILKCQYERPIPSRGNCAMCGRSGALGLPCSNGCTYTSWAATELVQAAADCQYQDDPDLDIRSGHACTYRIHLTPKKANMIDAVYWAEMMYQGVNEDQENYPEFMRKSKEERERKHDKIPSNLVRWEDPWLWVFRLHQDCEWYQNVAMISTSLGNDLEKPKSKKHRYT